MSRFKVLLVSGVAVGIFAGGAVALFTRDKKPVASTSTNEPSAVVLAPDAAPVATPSPPVVAPAAASAEGSATFVEVEGSRGRVREGKTNVAVAAALNEDGKKLLYAGKWTESQASFRKAFEIDPQPKYLLNLAIDLLREGKLDEAVGHLDRLRQLDLAPILRRKVDELSKEALAECKAQGAACTRAEGRP